MKNKNNQLEELYAQIDSMQECFTQMDSERTEQQKVIEQMKTAQAEMQRSKMDLELRLQTIQQESVETGRISEETKARMQKMEELNSQNVQEIEHKDSMLANLQETTCL